MSCDFDDIYMKKIYKKDRHYDYNCADSLHEWDAYCCCRPCSKSPFLSSYLEAVGNTQNIDSDADIVFDIDEDALDIAGRDIELSASGTTFLIKKAGLYHLEWSINLSSAEAPILIGLLENGGPSSALTNSATIGNYSSGALINVKESELPFSVRLHNFGNPISIENPYIFQNTAASIRILRFADGASSK